MPEVKKTSAEIQAPSLHSDLVFAIQSEVNLTSAPDYDLSNVFIPTWDNQPKEVPPLLSLTDVPFLTKGNTSGIIASPGVGKSSIAEAIMAKFLNPAIDGLGFSVSLDCQGILRIDMEMSDDDVWKSFARMCRRSGISKGNEVRNVKIAGFKKVARLEERKKKIEILLNEREYSILIMDGAGDLVNDTNDLPQAVECRTWLREISVKYNLSILTTIHPNPGSRKPRGHIGSELCRECECVVLAERDGSDVRIITSDFEYGKNRNSSHMTSAYMWSDEDMMFVSTDVPISSGKKAKTNKKKNDLEMLALKTIAPPLTLSRSEFERKIMQVENTSESTADRRVKEMLQLGLVIKHQDGFYRYNQAS